MLIWNAGDETCEIKKGEKFAQGVLNAVPKMRLKEVATVEELGATSRGEGGFGSTGK